MESTKSEVEKLKEQLELKMVEVKEKQDETNKLISVVTHESNIAAGEQEKANHEESITTELANAAAKMKGEADVELGAAKPAML